MTWLVVCRDSDGLWTSLRRNGFTSMQVHVGFMVNKFALGQALLPVPQYPLSVLFHQCPIRIHSSATDAVQYFSPSTSFSPVSIIPPMLHTHSFIYHRRCIMFFSQYFSFPSQYYSTSAPYSFIYSFIYCRRCIMFFSQYCTSVSTVSIIPPMLHTHSFIHSSTADAALCFSQYFSFPCQYHSTNAPYTLSIYHRRCIMFFSHYFNFPCQYHSTNAPQPFIHLLLTLYNVFLPVPQFSPVIIIPPVLHPYLHLHVDVTRRKNIFISSVISRNCMTSAECQFIVSTETGSL